MKFHHTAAFSDAIPLTTNPQQVLTSHGTDSTRLCILSNVSPQSDRLWSEEAFVGVERWQRKLWSLVVRFIKMRSGAASDKGGVNSGGSGSGILNSTEASNSPADVDGHIDFMRNSYLLQVRGVSCIIFIMLSFSFL